MAYYFFPEILVIDIIIVIIAIFDCERRIKEKYTKNFWMWMLIIFNLFGVIAYVYSVYHNGYKKDKRRKT